MPKISSSKSRDWKDLEWYLDKLPLDARSLFHTLVEELQSFPHLDDFAKQQSITKLNAGQILSARADCASKFIEISATHLKVAVDSYPSPDRRRAVLYCFLTIVEAAVENHPASEIHIQQIILGREFVQLLEKLKERIKDIFGENGFGDEYQDEEVLQTKMRMRILKLEKHTEKCSALSGIVRFSKGLIYIRNKIPKKMLSTPKCSCKNCGSSNSRNPPKRIAFPNMLLSSFPSLLDNKLHYPTYKSIPRSKPAVSSARSIAPLPKPRAPAARQDIEAMRPYMLAMMARSAQSDSSFNAAAYSQEELQALSHIAQSASEHPVLNEIRKRRRDTHPEMFTSKKVPWNDTRGKQNASIAVDPKTGATLYPGLTVMFSYLDTCAPPTGSAPFALELGIVELATTAYDDQSLRQSEMWPANHFATQRYIAQSSPEKFVLPIIQDIIKRIYSLSGDPQSPIPRLDGMKAIISIMASIILAGGEDMESLDMISEIILRDEVTRRLIARAFSRLHLLLDQKDREALLRYIDSSTEAILVKRSWPDLRRDFPEVMWI